MRTLIFAIKQLSIECRFFIPNTHDFMEIWVFLSVTGLFIEICASEDAFFEVISTNCGYFRQDNRI